MRSRTRSCVMMRIPCVEVKTIGIHVDSRHHTAIAPHFQDNPLLRLKEAKADGHLKRVFIDVFVAHRPVLELSILTSTGKEGHNLCDLKDRGNLKLHAGSGDHDRTAYAHLDQNQESNDRRKEMQPSISFWICGVESNGGGIVEHSRQEQR